MVVSLNSRLESNKEEECYPTPGRYWEFQNATFHFMVLNECAVPSETQLLVLSTSDLLLRISDPGTKFEIRLVSEIPAHGLAWSGDILNLNDCAYSTNAVLLLV